MSTYHYVIPTDRRPHSLSVLAHGQRMSGCEHMGHIDPSSGGEDLGHIDALSGCVVCVRKPNVIP